MREKGFATLLIAIIIAFLGGLGYWGYKSGIIKISLSRKETGVATTSPTSTILTTNTLPITPLPTADPATANWKTFENIDEGFFYKYPPNLLISPEPSNDHYSWQLYFSNQQSMDSINKCESEGNYTSDTGCMITENGTYLFHIMTHPVSKGVYEFPNFIIPPMFPDWKIGDLRDTGGQGPISLRYIEALTARGDKNYISVNIQMPDIFYTENYLKTNNYPDVRNLFRAILSTFKFTE